MNKCVCDICKTNTAQENFKVKQKNLFTIFEPGLVIPRSKWVDIDICETCYDQLVQVSKEGKKIDE